MMPGITTQTLRREGFRPIIIRGRTYYGKELIRGYQLIGQLTRQGNFVEPHIYHPKKTLLNIPLQETVAEEKHLPLGCKEEVNWLYNKAHQMVSGLFFEAVSPQDYC